MSGRDHPATVLIVDDIPANLGVVVECLEAHGLRVVVAQDGEEGVRRAIFVHPDLILMDVMMPGIDGFEACRLLKANDATRDIPVIFMTALADTAHKVAGFAAGSVDYVTKPFETAEVLARVTTHLALRDMQFRLARQNADLEAARLRLQSITDTLFEGLLLIDEAGIVVFANPSAGRLLGSNGEALVGEPIDGILRVRCESGDLGLGAVIAAHGGGGAWCDHDALFVMPCGRIMAVAYACAPLEEAVGARKTVASFRDIGALKAAQRDLMQASRLAGVGQLAAGIAHEINTPIQYIGDNLMFINQSLPAIETVVREAAASAARNAPGTDQLHQVLQDKEIDYLLAELPLATAQALEGTQAISQIVRSMKEFSHPGTSTKIWADINRAIESTVTVSRNEWKAIAAVEADLDPALPKIQCYPAEINQVLLNLIVNAVHAIASTGSSQLGTIRITTRRDEDHIEIRVADSGPGVPPAIQDKIFDPFFTTKDVGQGTGQGLYICHEVIAKKHGGRISLEEGGGAGATFVVRLPVAG